MKLGKRFILGIIDETEGFKPLAFAQSCSYDLTTTFVKVSSPNTGAVECVRPKTTGWALQHEGLLGRSDVRYHYGEKEYTLMAFLTYAWKNRVALTARWNEETPQGESAHDTQTKQGTCYIKSLKQVASEKALTKVSVALQGTGELQDLALDNLTGSFAYCINGTTLSLFAIDRPIANFSIVATALGTDSVVGTWSVRGERLQTFTVPANTVSVRGALIIDDEVVDQPGIAFSNASELNFVLVQTTTQQMDVTRRTVTTYWWGGVAMGDLTVTKDSQSKVFATTGKTAYGGVTVENFPFDILTGTVAATIGGPQTIASTDRTTSRDRILRITQTANNGIDWPANDYMTMTRLMLPDGTAAPFATYIDIWGEQESGRPAASVRIAPGQTSKDDPAYGLTPDAQHLHFSIGNGTDNGGPYNIVPQLVTDTSAHDVFYAYDANTQSLRIYCPDQVADAVLLAGGTVMLHSGNLYDLDDDGNRVPLTIDSVAAFSSLVTPYGTYTFHDVSAIRMLNLSNTITIDKLPLYDIILTYDGVQVGTLPALSSPDRTYPTYELVDVPGSVITGAQMPNGAAQTLTYASYFGTVVLKCSVTQTGNAQWTVIARLLGNSDGSGGPAVLPYNLSVKFGAHNPIVIGAGSSSATATGLTYNPSWQTPAAILPTSGEFTVLTSPAVDITPANWRADLCGTVGGLRCLDISYVGTIPAGITVTLYSENFMAAASIDSGRTMADSLYRTNRSTGDYSFTVNAGGTAGGFSVTPTEYSSNPVQLTYVVRSISSGYSTDLTNLKTDGVTRSRRTNIGDVLPFVRVRKNGTGYTYQTNPIYSPVSMALLKPGGSEAVSAFAYSGVIDDADGLVEFVPESDFGCTNIISVGNDLPGVQIISQNHTVDLPKA